MDSTEITAARMRQAAGRCGLHGCGLRLVPYADDGLDTPLDAWECPGARDDPRNLAALRERRDLDSRYPVQWDLKPGEVRTRLGELNAVHGRVAQECEESWLFTVPEAP